MIDTYSLVERARTVPMQKVPRARTLVWMIAVVNGHFSHTHKQTTRNFGFTQRREGLTAPA
jgi:hypothetical protein